MDPELPAMASRLERDLRHALRRRHEPAALPGGVAVVREQRRAAAAERAVGIDLDRAHGQEVAASAEARSLREERGQRIRLGRYGRVDADRERSGVGELRE
jgi:hypothetical protein